jgi:xylulokinase
MAYFMGVDVSTTGVKALIISDDGKVIASANTDIPLSTPKPLWSEQDPAFWWDGAIKSINQALLMGGIKGDEIKGIGLTGQMHGLTLLDKNNKVLRPAILWNDQRTAKQCDEIRNRFGKKHLIEVTGNDALTGFTAPKILWVKENEPSIYGNIAHILLPKDFVRLKLTGEYAVDKADGSGTILFDLNKRDWSLEMLDVLEIPLQWLPTTYEGAEITGFITKEASLETSLKIGTPVVGGGGDQAAQAVGVGAVQPGVVALTLGTSGVVFATTQQAFIEPEGRLHAFCHSVTGRWHLMGVMLSAAGSLRWYRDTFYPGMDYDSLLKPADLIVAGSEGLLFLPYLTGERTPYPDPYARGGFVGLTIRHTSAHITRSVLEGVAFGLKDSFELIKAAGLSKIDQIRVSGGGAKSPLWRQILANVLNAELVTVNTTEGAAFGAALLAGVGKGVWKDVDNACQAAIHITGSTLPDMNLVSKYNETYSIYKQLYPALKTISHQLSK